ncbi:MAG: hypothetical protein K9K64_08165, partial [Desulfohalobiaceae bacterium]|nr:hypothetical protein [Desulfohalobiaceae bacterium]
MLNQQAYFTTFTKLLAQVEDCCGQAADLNEENLFTVFAEKQKGEPIPPVDLIVADAAERSTLTKVSRGDPIQNRRSRRSIPQRQQDWHEPINNRQPVDKTSRGESECLSTRCHEIRTSLSGIKVMLELARMRNLEPKAAKPLDKARQFANHLLELINDFLDLSKIQSGKLEVRFQPFSLREVLRPCVGLFADKARDKGIDLNCTIGTDVPDRLCGDEGHLRRVLMNIVDNAVKFTDQGWVELRVERASQKSPDGSTEILFQVQDTGPGIALDRQTDIFESFEQVHSHQAQFGDTGLSLAISRHLVEIMGGEIL